MNVIVVSILGLISLVSLIGNLYLIGYVLKETYNVKWKRKRNKKNKTLKIK